MEVAIETSLKYPWVNQGWKKMLVGGGIFLLGYIGAVFCGTVIAVILTAAYQSLVQDVVQSEVNTIARMLGTLFGFIFSFAYLPILYGYFWEAVSQAKHKNHDYPELPNWSGHLGDFYKSGIKFYVWHQFCNLPLWFISFVIDVGTFLKSSEPALAATLTIGGLILIIVFYLMGFFLTPFLLVPISFNDTHVSWGELISIKKIITLGKKHYGNVLITCLLVVILQVVVGIGSLIGGILTCCIGFLLIPSIGLGLNLSNGLMLLQAYELDKQEASGQISA
jgi:hypothetical protein